ncbi:hypothetical protein [Nocardia sp. SC052]|uniref:hypothetical protein n=1 Tax=Nocardia sichangensis TaxID=3385975 RepID=UPI0039A03D46
MTPELTEARTDHHLLELVRVPDNPYFCDDRAKVPLTWFGPADRNPATATLDRCAYAVARPYLAPRLDAQARGLLDWAIRAATQRRLRFWNSEWKCTYDSAEHGRPIVADEWGVIPDGTYQPAVTYEHRRQRWTGRMIQP